MDLYLVFLIQIFYDRQLNEFSKQAQTYITATSSKKFLIFVSSSCIKKMFSSNLIKLHTNLSMYPLSHLVFQKKRKNNHTAIENFRIYYLRKCIETKQILEINETSWIDVIFFNLSSKIEISSFHLSMFSTKLILSDFQEFFTVTLTFLC